MKKKTTKLQERKERVRSRWLKSPTAENMNLLSFSKFLMALDSAKTHEGVDQLVRDWRYYGKSKGE